MKTFDSSLAPRFSQRLAQREAELRAILRSADDMPREAGEAEAHEVTDFKEMASEESLSVVDEAQAMHAAVELEQVLSAQQRLEDQRYGRCLDCDKAIDLRGSGLSFADLVINDAGYSAVITSSAGRIEVTLVGQRSLGAITQADFLFG